MSDRGGSKASALLRTCPQRSEVGPSPGWLSRAALAGCDAALIAMEAAKDGVRLSHLEVKVDSVSDDRGILAMDKSVPAGPLSIRVQVRLQGNAVPERLQEITRRAVAHCPIHEGAGRAVPMTLTVELG